MVCFRYNVADWIQLAQVSVYALGRVQTKWVDDRVNERITQLKPHAGIVTVLFIYGIVILGTFREYGITNDEHLHINYGDAILDWFVTLGADDRAIHDDRTYHYGGFFDLIGAVLSRFSPLDPFETKHLANALLALTGIIAAYRIGCLFGGVRAGLFAAIALILTPRYYGHAFNNPKDIPFAVFYLWSIYNLLRCVETFPKLTLERALWTGVTIGLTLAVRVGGVLLFGYGFLFLGLTWLLFRQKANNDSLPLVSIGVIAVTAVGLMLLFWPRAFVSPLTAPLESMTRFSAFPESHWSIFDGLYVNSLSTPRSYLPQWLTITLPEFVLAGLLFGVVQVAQKRRQWRSRIGVMYGLLVFSAACPVAYSVIKQPSLYDGMRHFLFVLPPLVTVSALSFHHALSSWQGKTAVLVAAVAVGSSSVVAREMIRLHPNQAVYFNHVIAGSVDEVSNRYETDYWRHAQKQALRWIAENYRNQYDRKIRVYSRFIWIKEQMPIGLEFVDYTAVPDFYIGSNRYDEHRTIPGEIVHTIRAGKAELVHIVKPDETREFDAYFTSSFWADTHRRLIYLREVSTRLRRGDRVGAARSHLKLARVYERLKPYEVRLEFKADYMDAEAKKHRFQAIELIASRAQSETVAARYLEDSNHVAARDLLLGLVSVYPDISHNWVKLIQALIGTGEYERALKQCREWQQQHPTLASLEAEVRVLAAMGDLPRAEAQLSEVVSRGSTIVNQLQSTIDAQRSGEANRE